MEEVVLEKIEKYSEKSRKRGGLLLSFSGFQMMTKVGDRGQGTGILGWGLGGREKRKAKKVESDSIDKEAL